MTDENPLEKFDKRMRFRRALISSAGPWVQVFWVTMLLSAVIYSLCWDVPYSALVVPLSAAAVLIMLLFQPFSPLVSIYRNAVPLIINLSIAGAAAGIVYLTGSKDSLLCFLYFLVPVHASSGFKHLGTASFSAIVSVFILLPYLPAAPEGMVLFSLIVQILALFMIGFVSSYLVEGGSLFMSESLVFRRKMLERTMEADNARMLFNLNLDLTTVVQPDEIFDLVSSASNNLLGAATTVVVLMRDDRPVTIFSTSPGDRPENDDQEWMHAGWARRLFGGREIVETGLEAAKVPFGKRGELYNLAAVPMRLGEKITGYLVACGIPPSTFREHQLIGFSMLASQAAIACERARLATLADEDRKGKQGLPD